MYSYLKQLQGIPRNSLPYYSHLIYHCFSLKSLRSVRVVHAQLIKAGFNSHTFLGNRCLDLYSHFGSVNDAIKVFVEICHKNTISWNIYLKGLLNAGQLGKARSLFDEMPVRDVVSWNLMISGYASRGFSDDALTLFLEMQIASVRPSGFTFTILMSLVSTTHHVKELHNAMIRSGMSVSNVVLGNSLIDIYGKLGLVDYAFAVFLTMEALDVISWNSLISGCCKSGFGKLALDQFSLMRSTGFAPDEFTVSTILCVCCDLRNLNKGKQIFALCVKGGFLSNTIVSSAAIDLFSKCNRLEDSVLLFEELDQLDCALSNSMISSFARHGFEEDALQLFMRILNEDFRPTEFTLSGVLSSISVLSVEVGSQFQSLAIKLGLDSDTIVASSLIEMYAKFGLIDDAVKIFANIGVRDLISRNIMIMGLTHNGRVVDALDIFRELLREGSPPDRITLAGILLACNYGGFVDEGMLIFSSMEEKYGVIPGDEHYACIVDLLCQANKLKEAIYVMETIPYKPNFIQWESILHVCALHGDLKLTERVAERMMGLEPQSPLPYLVLARAYEMRGRWEAMARVIKDMKQAGVKKVIGSSWIGIKNQVFTFEADQLHHHGGKDIYLILRLLVWEMEDEGNVYL